MRERRGREGEICERRREQGGVGSKKGEGDGSKDGEREGRKQE